MNQQRTIGVLVVGLPAGLVIIGVLSLVYYFNKGFIVDDPSKQGSLMRKSINKEDLESSVNTLANAIGERHVGKAAQLEIAAKWIESSLGVSNMGYAVSEQTYPVGDEVCRNLEVEVPGGSRKNEIVIVGAHYDSVPGCPAANDNGSGVAALLALAHAFVGSENARTLRFVAFTNEEMPHFQTDTMGSMQYAKRCRERGENVVAMLCLETIGYYSEEEGSQKYPEPLAEKYPSRGNFIAFVSNISSRGLLQEMVDAFSATTEFPVEQGSFPPDIPGVAWSDHWSFWQAGYPAVMVTDTAIFRYPHYHEPTDTPDKIDFDRMLEVVTGLEGVVNALVNPGK